MANNNPWNSNNGVFNQNQNPQFSAQSFPQLGQNQYVAPQVPVYAPAPVAQPSQPAGMGGFAGFAGFGGFAPIPVGNVTASTSFTAEAATGGTVFIPKKKQAELGISASYPALGATTTPGQAEKKKDENADPCHGKPKEFFIYDYDPRSNVCVYKAEQLTFVATYYHEHYDSPIDILMWLYDMAEYRDELKYYDSYSAPTTNTTGKSTKKKQPQEQVEEIDMEESTLSGPRKVKDIKKAQTKKPVAPPTKPQMKDGKQMTEAQKEQERLKKLKQMEDNKKKEEEKKMKNAVGKWKDLPTLEAENSNDLVEVDETRQPCSLVFIGHVDAGKSTISGNLMFAMGVVDKRTIEKYKEEAKAKNRESWWLAYVMDENEEEKAKGKTVEVGRANFDTPKKRWTIFDAPGHKNYVPNMIMGAALADYGALVISAKKGEFEAGFEAEGQTREHVQLAKSLGIYKLVIVVNKMDEPTVAWKKERYDEIVTALRPFLAQSGYDPDTDCTFIPVSGLQGENIDKVVDSGVCNWHADKRHLLQILDDLPVPSRDPNGPLRVPVLDKMSEKGAVWIFGKVESGTIKLGDSIKLMPSGITCQVHSILNGKEKAVLYAKPGENVQLRVNIDSDDRINKGDVICNRDQSIVPVSEIFEAEVDLFELISYKPILSKGYQCILHIHTVADECTVKEILVSYEKGEKGTERVEKQKPQFARSFAKIICRIETRIPIALEKHEVIPQLGRFTLRDEGRTIAVGKVLKYKPAKDTGGAPQTATASKTEEAKGETIKPTATAKEELVFDMESGKMYTPEEYSKIKQERAATQLTGINEDDEEDANPSKN